MKLLTTKWMIATVALAAAAGWAPAQPVDAHEVFTAIYPNHDVKDSVAAAGKPVFSFSMVEAGGTWR